MVNPAWTYGKWISVVLVHTLQAVVTSPPVSMKSTAHTMILVTLCENVAARVNCASVPCIIVSKNLVPFLARKLAGSVPTGSPRMNGWLKGKAGPCHIVGPAVTGHLQLALNTWP